METISFGGIDEITNTDLSGVKPDDEVGVITKMTSGVKRPERVNIFINGKYVFNLDVSQVVEYKVKVGQLVPPKRLEELKKASEFNRYWHMALEKALRRPHSEREMKIYLEMKTRKRTLRVRYRTGKYVDKVMEGMDPLLVDVIIKRLKEKKYLNDEVFVKFYSGTRRVQKGMSSRRLAMELRYKGATDELIEPVMKERDDEEEIEKVIEKKKKKYPPEKLFRYLVGQGFDFQLIRSKLEAEYGQKVRF
ncbi:RecX family transcriptional regulator [Candidatus Saccharibacteria bacterium]|nr:RecX family transcriptional regulator [Candidatus Saccharibacteria bacterium]